MTGNFTSSIPTTGSLISNDKTRIAIPQDVAQKMVGNQYNSFADMRGDFWKMMSQSPQVRNEFKAGDIWRMEHGYAPLVHDKNLYSKRFGKSYNLDHTIEIQDGGYVFDLDNITILAPKTHDEKTKKEVEARKCKS